MRTSTGSLRVVFVGWGAISRSAARLLDQATGEGSSVEIVAVAVRDRTAARPDLPPNARLLTSPDELRDIEADVVAEAAGRDSVGPWGLAALETGVDMIVSSVSALADQALLDSLRQAATRGGARLEIQPGALGGVDALAAARLMGVDIVEHRIIKPPRAWKDTPAEELCDLDGLSQAEIFFTANAAETADAFPKNANVAMTTALAGIGPDRTTITLVADPDADTNSHEITAAGAFGRLQVAISNQPLPDNPKTSAMAALNLVRAISNRVAPLVI